jgi:hypothetical protein
MIRMKSIYNRVLFALAVCIALVHSPTLLVAETFWVSHSAEDGPGSLRQAILESQELAGADTILFAIPAADSNFIAERGIWRITLSTPLPSLSDDSTHIDGHSQIEFTGDTNPHGLLIELDASGLPEKTPLLDIRSAGNLVSHLSFIGNRGPHLRLSGTSAHHNIITGCYIGVNASGQEGELRPHSLGIDIQGSAHHNQMGGPQGMERNIIAGMATYGIKIDHGSWNRILNNEIGIIARNAAGNGKLAKNLSSPSVPEGGGILIQGNSVSNRIGGVYERYGNIISCNRGAGIVLTGQACDSTRIEGNTIGLDANGETPMGNHGPGIWVGTVSAEGTGPRHSIIGGNSPATGNVIADNHEQGVYVTGSCVGTQIQHNKIGTDATCGRIVGNKREALCIITQTRQQRSMNHKIGPGNQIASGKSRPSGPVADVMISGPGTQSIRIFDNRIGLVSVNSFNPNEQHGVHVEKGAQDIDIGPDNTISHHTGYGVLVEDDSTRSVTISRNRITSNPKGAIEIRHRPQTHIEPPIITFIDLEGVQGVTVPGGIVEVFGGDKNNLNSFIGSVSADSSGMFKLKTRVDTLSVVATVTTHRGQTSPVSESRSIPIQIDRFRAQVPNDGIVELLWQTRIEMNNFGFYIQKSTDKEYWQDLGFVPGSGTFTEIQHYRFEDTQPVDGKIWYRLRQVDFEGNENYSEPLEFVYERPTTVDLMAPFPNPFNQSTQIEFNMKASHHISVIVLNLKGETVAVLLDDHLQAGSHQVSWNGLDQQQKSVASGVYLIFLRTPTETHTRKVILTK